MGAGLIIQNEKFELHDNQIDLTSLGQSPLEETKEPEGNPVNEFTLKDEVKETSRESIVGLQPTLSVEK